MNWSLADKWGWFWGEAAWPTRVLDIGHTFRFSVSLSLFITWVPDSGMGFAWISCTAVEQPCSPALSGHNPVDVLSVCRLSFTNVGGAAFPPMWREQRGTFSSSQTLFCSLPSVYSTVTRKQEQMRCWGTTDAHANPDKTRNNLTTDSVKNDQVRWIPWAWTTFRPGWSLQNNLSWTLVHEQERSLSYFLRELLRILSHRGE